MTTRRESVQDHDGKGIKTGGSGSIGEPRPPLRGLYLPTDRSGAAAGSDLIKSFFRRAILCVQAECPMRLPDARFTFREKISEVGCMMHGRGGDSTEARTSDPPRAHQRWRGSNCSTTWTREAKQKHEIDG